MAYWLMKTEPEEFSWDDQLKRGKKGEPWSGVRNFAARKHLQAMKPGEKFFFYHTGDEKQVVGSIFGSANIHSDIPKLLKLYRNGQLDLDSMITNTYKLGDINQGYQDMRDGKNIRGVLIYDD